MKKLLAALISIPVSKISVVEDWLWLAVDWPMFRHDLEHSGETSGVIIKPEDLVFKWKFETGGEVRSSPAVSGNYVYIGSDDNYIYCLDKDVGELKWKFETGGKVSSSPAVSGNYVYIGSVDKYIYCLDKNIGELKWKFETGRLEFSSPAVSGNHVYIGSRDNYIYCLDKDAGGIEVEI